MTVITPAHDDLMVHIFALIDQGNEPESREAKQFLSIKCQQILSNWFEETQEKAATTSGRKQLAY